jgi:acetyltransferase-like isoleucine patch superfamily enzyme
VVTLNRRDEEDGLPDRRPNNWLSLIAWLLPSCGFKLWALRSLGNHIGHDVVLGPNLVLNCGRFSIADGAAIKDFNIFRRLSSIELGPESNIGNFNQFTAAPDYQRYSPLVGKLMIGESGIVTNRHYVDCSGQVILRPFSAIAGVRSIIQSHELDYADNKTEPGRVVLGRNAVTHTGCILLKDSYLPERSLLAAGSVLTRAKKGDNMPASSLYGGAPARCIQGIKELEWWHRAQTNTPPVPFDDEKFRVE